MRSVLQLLTPGMYLTTIDLQDAYFLIPISEDSRKYVRFIYKKDLYQFTCLPFGLSVSPYIFTKIMKPVVKKLRTSGLLSTIYLDDLLCFGSSYEECVINTQTTIALLKSLGFLINYEKSCLTPNTKVQYLGFIVDSARFGLSLPLKKIIKLKNLIKGFQNRNGCPIREFSQLLGSLTAVCPAVPYGWVYCKKLERAKYLALLYNDSNYSHSMQISTDVKLELSWWTQKLTLAFNPIKTFRFQLEIFTDASLSGWGATCSGKKTRGFWHYGEQKFHINRLELLAVYLALRCFANDLCNCEILLRIDNTTAISYVNRMGGIKYPQLNTLARDIWQWAEERNIWLFASYIASADNITADHESRIKNLDTEWELSNSAFRNLIKTFGIPEIDLFASRINTKCKLFYARLPDPDCSAVDAFTVDWGSKFFYAFPPFSLILRVLRKIVRDKAMGIVVVPQWSSQPWYPLFSSLLISELIIFEPAPNILLSPCRGRKHPQYKSLSLAAGILFGGHIRTEI